jgi:hypothetical protein
MARPRPSPSPQIIGVRIAGRNPAAQQSFHLKRSAFRQYRDAPPTLSDIHLRSYTDDALRPGLVSGNLRQVADGSCKASAGRLTPFSEVKPQNPKWKRREPQTSRHHLPRAPSLFGVLRPIFCFDGWCATTRSAMMRPIWCRSGWHT